MIAELRRSAAARLGRGYVAGAQLADALGICRKAGRAGWGVILGYWDGPGDSADTVQAQALDALGGLALEGLDGYVSVKTPALEDGELRLQSLLAQAGLFGLRVHLDAHAFEHAEAQHRLVYALLAPEEPRLGATLPARWRRSLSDAARLRDEPLPLRVVKGQWPDPHDPERDARRGFLEVVDALAGRSAPVAVATHDAALAREALLRLRSADTPCELEQLYGLPPLDARVARPLGVRVRLYVPYGAPSLPYGEHGPALAKRVVRDVLQGWRG